MTQAWPQEPVSFAGKRIALIGTGSSGIQAAPVIAASAKHLTVFQRTPNFSIPGRNRDLSADEVADRKAEYPDFRRRQANSHGGVILDINYRRAPEMTPAERRAELQRRWSTGGALDFMVAFRDMMTNLDANMVAQDFVRARISATVTHRETAKLLCPTDHPIGTKRPCVDHGYFEMFNRENVSLVSVRDNPIAEITSRGVKLVDGSEHEVDMIVYALGYDAITGAMLRMDIRGRGGVGLSQHWANGPATYLGLSVANFPNMFTITGPGSPGVLVMMIAGIEHHVRWIADCITYLRDHHVKIFEATPRAQEAWTNHVADLADGTLYPRTRNSYYMGSNVPGKPAVFALYTGGLRAYRRCCDEVAADGYAGFALDGNPVVGSKSQPANSPNPQ
jgi:cyclohexanone monooxygenase